MRLPSISFCGWRSWRIIKNERRRGESVMECDQRAQ